MVVKPFKALTKAQQTRDELIQSGALLRRLYGAAEWEQQVTANATEIATLTKLTSELQRKVEAPERAEQEAFLTRLRNTGDGSAEQGLRTLWEKIALPEQREIMALLIREIVMDTPAAIHHHHESGVIRWAGIFQSHPDTRFDLRHYGAGTKPALRRSQTMPCQACGQPVTRRPCDFIYKTVFCNRRCYNNYRAGIRPAD